MANWKRRVFPDPFKRTAVERVRTSGMTIISVAEDVGLHETERSIPKEGLVLNGLDDARRDLFGYIDGLYKKRFAVSDQWPVMSGSRFLAKCHDPFTR